MKEAVELANALLGPRSNAQQIDGPLKKPLEILARAVLEADRKIQELEKKLAEAADLALKMADDKSHLADKLVGSYEKQDQDDRHT